jgi:proton-translocating NADH-quinone oxidoreductase chain N
MDFNTETLICLAPYIILAVFATVVVLLPKSNRRLSYILSLVGIGLAGVASGMLWGIDTTILNGSLEINNFSVVVNIIFCLLSFVVVAGSHTFCENLRYTKDRTREYYALIMFATIGLMALGSVTDFITLFVAFELVSIATYVLPLIDCADPRGKEAAIKYFLMGAFSSALILYGMSLLYGYTGSMNIEVVASQLAHLETLFQPIILISVILMLAGFGYKMALVPFHLWAPDTYTGSPAPVSAFLAGVTKKGAFVVSFKVFLIALVALQKDVFIILGIIAILTMCVGNCVALMQNSVKRMLAYSSIAHAGYILVGIAIFTQMAVAGSLMHIIAHGLMAASGFFVVYLISEGIGGEDIDDYRGLNKLAPYTAFAFMVILLSLAGVPPFLGFWSKMVMVVASFQYGGWCIVLAVFLVLNSALSLVFYARVIKTMYMDPPLEANANKIVIEKTSYTVAIYISMIILTVTGLFPNEILKICTAAVGCLIH